MVVVAQHRNEMSAGRRSTAAELSIYDEAFAFCVLSVTLFAWLLGSLVPVLAVLLLIAFFAIRRQSAITALTSNWAILLLPAFALMSTLWSIAPGTTAYYAIQYLLTAMLGILVGAGLKRERAFIGVFAAFAIFTIASFAFGRSVGWGGGAMGNTAFAGLVASKNSMGDIAAIGALASLAFFFLSLAHARFLLGAGVFALFLLQVHLTQASQSSGAVIGVFVGIAIIFAWGISCSIPRQYRILLGGLLFAILLFLFFQRAIWFPPLIDMMATAFNKSPTLTGRTPIWEHADRLIAERPMLGLGFSAFWVHGNLDAEGIWRSMGITNRAGFNFHSTPLEILVHLGLVGFILFLTIFLLCSVRLFARTLYQPDVSLIFWSSFIAYQLSRMYAETRGVKLFDYGTTMFFLAMTMGASSRPEIRRSWRVSPRYR